MAMIVFTTIYGKHTAKPLETVDVTVVDTDIPETNEIPVGTMEQTKNQGDSADAVSTESSVDETSD